jgi:hypothetical protein
MIYPQYIVDKFKLALTEQGITDRDDDLPLMQEVGNDCLDYVTTHGCPHEQWEAPQWHDDLLDQISLAEDTD